MTGRSLRSFRINIPPLAEQKRIVAKVDELMGLCDRLEALEAERKDRHASLSRAALARFAASPTPTNLQFLFHKSFDVEPVEVRKGILRLAVQGKLLWNGKSHKTWDISKLKDLATKIGSGATPSGGRENYHSAGIPLIRSMNVYFGDFRDEGIVFLDDEQASALKNVEVQVDDVLLNITGASIGRTCRAPHHMSGARVNQHVCIVRTRSEILPSFLELYFASPIVQDYINEIQVGATRQALTKGMIEKFEIPVPPLNEQKRIVAKVDELMALVDQLEQQLANSRNLGQQLLEAVVAELTKG